MCCTEFLGSGLRGRESSILQGQVHDSGRAFPGISAEPQRFSPYLNDAQDTAPTAQKKPRNLGLTEAFEQWLVYVGESMGSHIASFNRPHWHFQGTASPVSHRCVLILLDTIPVGY